MRLSHVRSKTANRTDSAQVYCIPLTHTHIQHARVKEGYTLSCIIYVTGSEACCFEHSKLSSEGQWNSAPRDPPPPSVFGFMPEENMKISVPAAQCHEDSDNETQINSPAFDLWEA